jgi:2-hydroxychromene-2-carboxylate isomerase
MMATILAFAQGGGGTGGDDTGGTGGGRGGGMGDDTGGMPRMQRQTPFDIFADRLKLNKDQKAEAQTVLVDAMKESAPLRQQLAQGRAAMANAILGSKSADDQKKIMDAYISVVAQETGIETKAFAKVYAMLKPNQQGKATAAFEVMAGIFNAPPGGGGRRGRN